MTDISNEENKFDDEIELEDGTYSEPLVINFENIPEKANYKITITEESFDDKKDSNVDDLEINIAKMTAKTFASFMKNLSGNKIQKYANRYNKNHMKLMQLLNDESLKGEIGDVKKRMQSLAVLMIKVKNPLEVAVNSKSNTGDEQLAKAIKVSAKVVDLLKTLKIFAEPDETSGAKPNPYNKLSDALDFVFTDEEQEIMNDIQKLIETKLKTQKNKSDITISDTLQKKLIKQLGLIPKDLVGKVKSLIAIADEDIKNDFIAHNKGKPTDIEKLISEGALELADIDFSNKLQELFINSQEDELNNLIEVIIRKKNEEKERLPEVTKNKLANFKEKATIDANLSSAILGIKNSTDDISKIFQDSSNPRILQNFIEETIDLLNTYNCDISNYILPEYSFYTAPKENDLYGNNEEADDNSLYERRKDAEAAFTNPTAAEIYLPRTSFISGLTTSDTQDEHKLIDDNEMHLVEDVFIKTIQAFFNEKVFTEQDFKLVADYFKNNPTNDELPQSIKEKLIKYTEKVVVYEEKSKPEVIHKVLETPRPVQLISEKSYALADTLIAPSILNDLLHEQLKNNKDAAISIIDIEDEEEKFNENIEIEEPENSKEEFIAPAILDEALQEQLRNNEINEYPPAKLISKDILNEIVNEQINDDLIQETFFTIQSVIPNKKEKSFTNFNILINTIGNYGQLIGNEAEKAKKLNSSLVNKIRINALELATNA